MLSQTRPAATNAAPTPSPTNPSLTTASSTAVFNDAAWRQWGEEASRVDSRRRAATLSPSLWAATACKYVKSRTAAASAPGSEARASASSRPRRASESQVEWTSVQTSLWVGEGERKRHGDWAGSHFVSPPRAVCALACCRRAHTRHDFAAALPLVSVELGGGCGGRHAFSEPRWPGAHWVRNLPRPVPPSPCLPPLPPSPHTHWNAFSAAWGPPRASR